ncbi:hypothetical protein PYW07_001451 [Mythimna separata]|uniref:Endonuclease/exonuclease/phosphatase domain-containing protein n=1 Tax=Mythimna separata TaxID=271217 RepID=A0AAD7YSC4_MYTSE|nr:hypothetical protein PYW07_001451 [Mythimna separata]
MEVVETTSRRNEFLKRPISGDGRGSTSGEEDSRPSARKIPTSSRGVGRKSGKGRGLAVQDRSKDTAIEGPYPAENSCQAAANPGLSDGEPDPEECPNIVLPQKFLEAVAAAVKGVALKRAKASKDIAISEAIASINAAAVDAIEDLRAEVTRQAAGLEALRKENQSHREDQAGLRGEPGPQMPQKEGHNQPQPETENQLLTMVKQELAAFQQQQQQQQQQFQQRMQQQLSVLEGIVLRPSLAGSARTPPKESGGSKIIQASSEPNIPSASTTAVSNVCVRQKRPRMEGSPDPDPESQCSKSELIDSIRQEIRSVLSSEISTNIKKSITNELGDIKSLFQELKQSVDFISEEFDRMKAELETCRNDNKILHRENDSLRHAVSELSSRVNLIEQHARQQNLEINGIPESKTENLVKTVQQIGNVVSCSVKEDDILSVVRVRKLDPESNNPRAVVVKLRSMLQRDTILTSVMKYNKAHPDKKLNSQLLGLAAQLNNYDVIIGTETWLDDSVNDGELFDSRYIIYRRDRASTPLGSKKGGGVLIAVSRAMDSTRVSKWESDAEDLWVKLKTEGRKGNVYICAAYLPPPVQQAPLNSILDNVDAVIEATGGDVIIAGDFNLGFIDWSTDNSLSSPPSTTARNFANRTYVNNPEDNIRLNPKAF